MKKKRILQVTGGLGIGGIERITTSFFEKIDKSKYEMDYLVYGDNIGEFEKIVLKNGGKILRVPIPRAGYYKFYKNVVKIMKDNGPYDVVHTHVLFNSGFIVRAAFKTGVPRIIAHSHDNLNKIQEPITKKIYNIVMRRWLNRYSTKICACSMSAGEYLFGKRSFEKNGIILKNKIDIDKFEFNELARKKIRKEYRINDELVIGNIGRLEEQKNQEYLLLILKEILKNNKNAKLLLIGDGSLKNTLNKKIEQLGIENNVIMTGQKENINELLSAMDVFVLTSIHEGLGIVLIEAQANGLRCLAPKYIVPNEAQILDSFKFMNNTNINEVNNWVEELNKKNNRTERTKELIKKAGYDLNSLAEELEKLYNA